MVRILSSEPAVSEELEGVLISTISIIRCRTARSGRYSMFSISCISSSGGMSGVVISDVEERVSEESEPTLLIWTLILSVAVLRPFGSLKRITSPTLRFSKAVLVEITTNALPLIGRLIWRIDKHRAMITYLRDLLGF